MILSSPMTMVYQNSFNCRIHMNGLLVQFQQRLETSKGRSNLQTLFNLETSVDCVLKRRKNG